MSKREESRESDGKPSYESSMMLGNKKKYGFLSIYPIGNNK